MLPPCSACRAVALGRRLVTCHIHLSGCSERSKFLSAAEFRKISQRQLSPPPRCRCRRACQGHPRARPQPVVRCVLRCCRSMLTQIQRPNLARSPMPVRLLEAHHLADHPFSQLIGMTQWPPRLLRHPGQTISQQPLPPLVASLGADPIFLTQRTKVVRLQRLQSKLHSLFHRFTFSPGHA